MKLQAKSIAMIRIMSIMFDMVKRAMNGRLCGRSRRLTDSWASILERVWKEIMIKSLDKKTNFIILLI